MKTSRKKKCCHCRKLFRPDPRNFKKQSYCSEPACRKASKAASQKKMTRKGPIKVGAAVATSSHGMGNCGTIIRTATVSGVAYDAVINSLEICRTKNLSSTAFPPWVPVPAPVTLR